MSKGTIRNRWCPSCGVMELLCRVLCIFCIGILGTINFSYADELIPSSESAAVSYPPTVEGLEQGWAEVQEAIQSKDIRRTAERLTALNRAKIRAGYESADSYSQVLIREGVLALNRGDRQLAGFYERKAHDLSPNSPKTLLLSVWLSREGGSSSMVGQIVKALIYSSSNPQTLFQILSASLLPAFWAITVGIYLTLLITIIFRIQPILRAFLRRMPASIRGFLGPLIFAAILIAPVPFGPLWSILVWTVMISAHLNYARWVIKLTGVLFTLWGAGVFVQSNLESWLSRPALDAILAEISGDFNPDFARHSLSRGGVPSDQDPLLSYALGLRHSRLAEIEEADKAFAAVEVQWGAQPWTFASRATLAAALQEYPRAETLLKEATEMGLNSVEVIFNRSKIAFEMGNNDESRELTVAAQRRDGERVSMLEARAEGHLPHDPREYAPIKLPWYKIFEESFRNSSISSELLNSKVSAIMPGLNVLALLLIGFVLSVKGITSEAIGVKVRGHRYYENYTPSQFVVGLIRALPGGAFVIAGYPVLGSCLIALIVWLIIPATHMFSIAIPELDPLIRHYRLVVSLVAAGIILLGFAFRPREE